ncbi:MAG: Bax inhibitor-1/YccA family protein [Bacteroidales bacterium]|nr:Bax inhibitor-1/YccA family protein [Bacteroidales bacterium]
MRFTNTSNPVLTNKAFSIQSDGEVMTIKGTVNKSLLLFLILLITASLSWKLAASGSELLTMLLWPSAIIGFVLAIITIFAKKYAMYTAPLYVAAQGFFLGAISMVYNFIYPGIIIQAVLLTAGILGVMLFAYKTGMIKVTQKFRSGILIATGGIAIVYLASFIMNIFGMSMPYIHEGGPIGIGISLFIVIIAALNLILDFSFIEEASHANSPKYMEWYAAFGLMVTLIWLYLEILRLLGKIRR